MRKIEKTMAASMCDEIVIAVVIFFFYLEKFWDQPQVRGRSLNNKAGNYKLHKQALNNAYLTTRHSPESLRK